MAHLKEIHLKKFKRFTDTRFINLPPTARLIILAGPNGSGKSSLFDGLKTWHWYNGAPAQNWDESYGAKVGEEPGLGWTERVTVQFHETLTGDAETQKKLIYVRSAFRNEAEFDIGGISRLQSPLDSPRISRTIDNDASVSDNYQRLIMATIDGIYSPDVPDSTTKRDIRERVIGKVQEAMRGVFENLELQGVGGAFLSGSATTGTFYFAKGRSKGFLYKNLSAGEKAAFDLILDAVVKGEFYNDTTWCIDEPEGHLNTRVQGKLLDALLELIPKGNQLVLATHSIGFMRRAWQLAQSNPESAVFLDMQDIDFDEPQVIEPTTPSREFWVRTLDVALGDLAHLVAPEEVVICEGRPASEEDDDGAEFDASCYRTIFGPKMPNTDFLSVGNKDAVEKDRLGAGRAIQTLVEGTRVIRLVDRDLLTDNEEVRRKAAGVRVLSRRNIEAFLLDEEVLSALCTSVGRPELSAKAHAIRTEEMNTSISQGHDSDDWKKPAARIQHKLRRELGLARSGSNWTAFARDILAPLIRPEMQVYQQLEKDIFGSE